MDLYLAGAEIPAYRKLLANEDHHHVAISYMGLRRRTKFTRGAWLFEEKFGDDAKILLDSGAYTLNNKPVDMDIDELAKIAEHYYEHVVAPNLHRVDYYVEFNANTLGVTFLDTMREDSTKTAHKAVVVWDLHRDDLDELCSTWQNIGVTKEALADQHTIARLTQAVRNHDVKLFGLGITKPEVMAMLPWHAVTSTSWLSPSQFGDTIWWDGRELHRYPTRYKDSCRKRHRPEFVRAGFDHELIEDDDSTELLRVSVWSWNRLLDNINAKGVTPTQEDAKPENADSDLETVGAHPPEKRHEGVSSLPAKPREKVPLPGISLATQNTHDGTEGRTQLRIVDSNLRRCSNCFIANECPAFDKESECAYKIPVELRTKDDLDGLRAALKEIQTTRVLVLYHAEQVQGGYPNPLLDTQLDRLMKMLKIDSDLSETGVSVTITAKQRGEAQTGLLSRLFGDEGGEQARALPAPVPMEDAAVQLGIVDAEILNE